MFTGAIIAGIIYIVGWIMAGITLLTAWFVELAAKLLDWVISGIPYAYTSGGVVAIGWPLCRDLANIVFVIALVFIGLGTALRIRDYQAKKTLPILIIIALLVNFTPVICGLIVDFFNIIMNFFVSELNAGQFIHANWEALKAAMPHGILEGLNPFENIDLLLNSLILIFVNLVLFFIFLLFCFIFFLRYVVIWILVIISPFAFASYILPATRGFWGMWWKQFLQWSMIGVIAGFFLYLGTHIMGSLETLQVPPQGTVGPVDMLINIMPFLFTAAFYAIGLFLAISTSAIGAGQIMNLGQKAGAAVGKATGKFTGGAIRRIPAISRAEETVRRRLEGVPIIGRALGGAGAFEKGRQAKIASFEKQFEGLPPGELRRIFHQPAFTYDDTLKKASLYKFLEKKGELGTGTVQENAREQAYLPTARALGIDVNDILKRRPDWAPVLGQTVPEAMARIEPETFYKDVQREALSNPEVVLSFLRDEAKFREFGRKAKASKKREVVNFFNTNAPVPPRDYLQMMQRAERISTDANWRV